MEQGELKDLLEFQINRNIINLYKTFLMTLEDMHHQHKNSFKKLKQALPDDSSLIDQADYWDQDRMDYLRKKILDQGNNSLREIVTQLEQFNLIAK